MRSAKLSEAICEIQDGASSHDLLAAFVRAFDVALNDEARFALIEEEPALSKDERFNAMVGALAEYLAKQYKLGRVPAWVSGSARYLDHPWHTSSMFIDWKRELLTDGMREYLTFASPAEFASHNIFTDAASLRRARGPRSAQS
ncbi:hypothetical protein [Bradyrhizobium sp.]|uniref:hypothetical protein n=1 Tax=Bradyrhizobium sp. TaxID=376 RepID=UPI004037DA16